jgi:hypothetical protein
MPDERPPPTYFGAPPRSLALGATVAARVTARLRMFAAFAVRLARTWVRTAREVVALHIERYRLGRSRRTLQYELGGAVLADDEPLVADLRRRLHVCIEERERLAREARRAVVRARSETTEERSAIAPTEIRHAD